MTEQPPCDIAHPLAAGTVVVSVAGEWDQDDGCRRRDTGPMAQGYIVAARHYAAEGWVYEVVFPAWDVTINLTQADDPLDDPTYYRFGPPMVGDLATNHQGYTDAEAGEPLFPDADPDYAAGWQSYHARAALAGWSGWRTVR